MAVTLNYELGAETGALTEFSSTEGTITQDTSFKFRGTASWKFGAGGTGNIVYGTIGGVADAGNGHIVGFASAWDDTVPGVGEAYDWYRHSTLDPFKNLAIRVEENGDISLSDDGGTVRGTWNTSGGLTTDTFYFFELYFEVASGTAGVLGPLYVNGVEKISQITGLDTFDAAAPYQDRFLHNTFGAGPNLAWLDSYYHISGASSIADRQGVPALRATFLHEGLIGNVGKFMR